MHAHLQEHPEELDASLAYLIALFATENSLDAALETMTAAVYSRPDDPARRYWLAQVLDELGRTEEAITEYRRAFDLGLPDPGGRTHLRLGDLLYDAGYRTEAREAWQQAVDRAEASLRPDAAKPLPTWARVLIRLTSPVKRTALSRLRRFGAD